MNSLQTFESPGDFLFRFFSIFRGPTFLSTFRNVDPVFREKLLLVVSMANDCAG